MQTAKDYIRAIFESDPTPKTNMQMLDACIARGYQFGRDGVIAALSRMAGDGILNRHQPNNRNQAALYSPTKLVPVDQLDVPIVRASTYSWLTAPDYVPDAIQPLRPGAMAFKDCKSHGTLC